MIMDVEVQQTEPKCEAKLLMLESWDILSDKSPRVLIGHSVCWCGSYALVGK